MRKRFWVVLLLAALTTAFAGCRRYQAPWDSFCFSSEDHREIALDGAERDYVIRVLNSGKWSGDSPEGRYDFVFYTAKQEVRYDSRSGIFYDVTGKRSLTVSDEERAVIGRMLFGGRGGET